MVAAQHMFVQQFEVGERSDSRRPIRNRLAVLHPVDDVQDFTAPEPRTVELLELLEAATATDDADTRRIIEAELFACGIPVAGGRDV